MQAHETSSGLPKEMKGVFTEKAQADAVFLFIASVLAQVFFNWWVDKYPRSCTIEDVEQGKLAASERVEPIEALVNIDEDAFKTSLRNKTR